MPRKKEPELDGDAIAQAIAKDLPGWSLSKKSRSVDAMAAEAAARATPGTNLKLLRKKFLGPEADAADSDAADGSDDSNEDYGALDSDRVTVSIEPEKGGASKVADVVKGKIKIVQG